MALVTPATNPSMDASTGMLAPQIPDLIAGEDLLAAAPCYIKAADGKAWMANGTALNEAARVAGFTARATKAGQATTLFGSGARFRYATGMSPGTILYLATTSGRLDTVATVGDPATFGTTPAVTVQGGTAQVINATDIRVIRNF